MRRTLALRFPLFAVTALQFFGCGFAVDGNVLLLPADLPDEEEPDAPCTLNEGPEGEFVGLGSLVEATRPICETAFHATAGAEGATIRVTLDSWDSDSSARLIVTDLLGQSLAEFEGGSTGSWLQLTLDRSGEYLITVEPGDPEAAANDYSLSASCVADCREFTRYPLVFLHGMAGTDTFVGVMDYWYDVAPLLEDAGFVTRMPPGGALAEPAQRAQEFSAAIDLMEEEGLGRRFNLFGHSQGGVDARYLITTLDQGLRIASLTTIATPHHGTPVADAAAGTVFSVPGLSNLIDQALTEVTQLLGLGAGEIAEATRSVTTEAMAEFNATVPDSEHTSYYSWSARTCGYAEWICQANYNGEVVRPMFWASYRLVDAIAGANDGLVPIDSAQWGEHLGTLSADHLDEVGLFFGETGTFDHRSFYLSEARRLADEGF